MPTILVADDNSNIQKMVCLAVKDLAVDVVSVANGEAAVRKLKDLLPDLILADIFMPVRSGYEVCEFVKHNPRLAGIPVVLLTGAFDPFDEKEAERVGADGVLKKPFVSPDPLLAMVKQMLDRSPVPVGATAGTSAAPSRSQLSAAPSAPAASNIIEMRPPAEEREADPIPEEPAEAARPAYPTAESEDEKRFEFKSSFAPSPTSVESEAAPAPRGLGEEFRSWNHPSEVAPFSAAVPEEEEAARKYWESDPPPLPRRDESGFLRAAEFEEASAPVPATLAEESPVVAAEAPEASAIVEPEPAAQGWFAEAAVETPAAAESEQLASIEEVAAPSNDIGRASESAEMPTAVDQPEPAQEMNWPLAVESQFEPLAPAAINETAPAIPAEDAAPVAATSGEESCSTSFETPAIQEEPFLPLPEETAQVQSWSVPPPPDPALVQAMVDSVIERMQPQIMDIVRREVLRPVIEALVRREFENKK